jgi:hypothetical protein
VGLAYFRVCARQRSAACDLNSPEPFRTRGAEEPLGTALSREAVEQPRERIVSIAAL